MKRKIQAAVSLSVAPEVCDNTQMKDKPNISMKQSNFKILNELFLLHTLSKVGRYKRILYGIYISYVVEQLLTV
jgi:hypothetical protein